MVVYLQTLTLDGTTNTRKYKAILNVGVFYSWFESLDKFNGRRFYVKFGPNNLNVPEVGFLRIMGHEIDQFLHLYQHQRHQTVTIHYWTYVFMP